MTSTVNAGNTDNALYRLSSDINAYFTASTLSA